VKKDKKRYLAITT